MKNYEDFLKRFEKIYYEDIKPLIAEEGSPRQMAGALLKNIAKLVENDKDIFNCQDANVVSSGIGLLDSINSMSHKLSEGTFNPGTDFDNLERYLSSAKISSAKAPVQKEDTP